MLKLLRKFFIGESKQIETVEELSPDTKQIETVEASPPNTKVFVKGNVAYRTITTKQT